MKVFIKIKIKRRRRKRSKVVKEVKTMSPIKLKALMLKAE